MRHPRRRGRKVTERKPRVRKSPREGARTDDRPTLVRLYAYRGYLVEWHNGKFTLREGENLKQYGKPPPGLRSRIDKALDEGKTNG